MNGLLLSVYWCEANAEALRQLRQLDAVLRVESCICRGVIYERNRIVSVWIGFELSGLKVRFEHRSQSLELSAFKTVVHDGFYIIDVD